MISLRNRKIWKLSKLHWMNMTTGSLTCSIARSSLLHSKTTAASALQTATGRTEAMKGYHCSFKCFWTSRRGSLLTGVIQQTSKWIQAQKCLMYLAACYCWMKMFLSLLIIKLHVASDKWFLIHADRYTNCSTCQPLSSPEKASNSLILMSLHSIGIQWAGGVSGSSTTYLSTREHISLTLKKLTYLHHLLHHGPAKHVIEGLLGMGSEYFEAIECLQKSHDRPRVLHHTHVQAIVKAPAVKDGSSK